ncbi:MAG: ATP-binding cassette domain-containing protein [Chloroflexi bacterium]|nr:ATP-binding cassette domain-containing protein [Chloroflexota bacterium]
MIAVSDGAHAAPMIDVRDLARRFGRTEAVKGVSFAVAAVEVFGFLGPNGAGKTTAINMLCALLRPSGGSATANGFDVVCRRRDVRRSIGLVFQQPTVHEALSAAQNRRFHAYAYGVPAGVREQRLRELLTLVEMWDRRGESVLITVNTADGHAAAGELRRRYRVAATVTDGTVSFQVPAGLRPAGVTRHACSARSTGARSAARGVDAPD